MIAEYPTISQKVTELAAELAAKEVYNTYGDAAFYVDESDGVEYYHEKAQDLFMESHNKIENELFDVVQKIVKNE